MFRDLPSYKVLRRGRFRIEHKKLSAGSKIPVVSFRQALFEGKWRPQSVSFEKDIVVSQLHDKENGMWMSTSLQELAQMEPFLRRAKGTVLVGGLGLGCIAHLLVRKPEVYRVIVVEREKDLIKLVQPQIDSRVEVILGDLFNEVKQVRPGEFDAAFIDIWQTTGEWSWQTQVVPLRRLLHDKVLFKNQMYWQEDEMQSQVELMLYRAADIHAEIYEDSPSFQHYWVFRKAVEHLYCTEPRISKDTPIEKVFAIEAENRQNPKLQFLVKAYLKGVGTKAWERRFGKFWDKSLEWPKVKEAFKV